MQRNHLVILKKQYLDLILCGTKTIESRLLKTRQSPVGLINPGDKLFLKQSSGPVCATATVKSVKTFEDLTPQKNAELKTFIMIRFWAPTNTGTGKVIANSQSSPGSKMWKKCPLFTSTKKTGEHG